MGRRRKQPSPFLDRVLLPGLRSTILAFAVLAVGFGSWLETTPGIDDCSFKQQMSMQQVSLYRNLSGNDNLPDTVSFGLWRHCFIYALNCSCTAPSLTYGLDADTVLTGAFSNQTLLPVTHAISYWRAVPLIMATVLSAAAFFFGIAVNILRQRRLQLANASIILASIVLVAIAFGYTQQQYRSDIEQACKQFGYRCMSIDHGAEFIALVLGLALLGAALITWIYAPDNSTNEFPAPLGSAPPKGLSQKQQQQQWSPSNSLDPWQEAAMYDDQLRWQQGGGHHSTTNNNNNSNYQPIHDEAFAADPLPPPPGRRRTSRGGYIDLIPPSRPFASSPTSPRRGSHGSGNTFGANNMGARGSRTSSTMLDSPGGAGGGGGSSGLDDYYYTSSDSNSPTASHRRQSSGAMSSTFAPQQRRRSHSPFRATTPAQQQPSNHRTITDERISAYLQRGHESSSPSS